MTGLCDIVFAPVILPLLGAALAFCAKAARGKTAASALEYAGVILGLALPWIAFLHALPLLLPGEALEGVIGHWHSGVGIRYRFDSLSWLVNLLGFSVSAAAWIYSRGAGPAGPLFSAMLLIQTAALAATMVTADLFNLFVCLEVMGITSYVLIAMTEKPGATLASFSYLMVSATAMVFYLIGMYGLYRLTGALSYDSIAGALRVLPDSGGRVALVSLALIVSAVAMRVAVMPLYGWLPDAHALAPHAVSAVLSGVLIKTPLFALSRVLLILPAGAEAGLLMGYAGAFTAVAAVVLALSQKDAKRLLAYHSVSQIGYVVSAWGAAVHAGVQTESGVLLMAGAYLHALYHALFKGLLFLSVGTTIDRAGERDVYRLRGAAAMLRAGGERFPLTLICFAVGALAISAIPPLNGYASKSALSHALKGTVHYYLLAAAAAGTVASFIKLSRIYWPPGRRDGAAAPAPPLSGHGSAAIWLSQALLAALCVAGGLAAPGAYRLVVRLLSPCGGLPAVPYAFYSAGNLLGTAVTVLAGAGVFVLATTPQGTALLRMVRERPRSFQGLFVSFALCTAALAAWLLW